MKLEYQPDELLPLSGIQHFVFCRRQWALIHVERQWQENVLTVEGKLMHDKADILIFPRCGRMWSSPGRCRLPPTGLD